MADEAAALRRRLDLDGIWGNFSEIGVRQELTDWQWSAEFVHIAAKPLSSESSVALMLGRRIGDWTPYAGYGWAKTSGAALAPPSWGAALQPLLGPAGAAQGQALGAGAAQAYNATRVQQSSWSVGARWDFHPQAALKLQWDEVRVSANGAALWGHASTDAGRARVASAVVDFIF
ncbi:hypothetical protein ROSA5918_00465 [Roseateles saccharophilus]|uniref:Porin-like protein n=1 Tax=Roseateles saccharophilus TaxID=304 RepID=A0A4R3VF96_ROSSA|nr:hypothetical protein EV671_1004121 [Roseateles saccharophilus]